MGTSNLIFSKCRYNSKSWSQYDALGGFVDFQCYKISLRANKDAKAIMFSCLWVKFDSSSGTPNIANSVVLCFLTTFLAVWKSITLRFLVIDVQVFLFGTVWSNSLWNNKLSPNGRPCVLVLVRERRSVTRWFWGWPCVACRCYCALFCVLVFQHLRGACLFNDWGVLCSWHFSYQQLNYHASFKLVTGIIFLY